MRRVLAACGVALWLAACGSTTRTAPTTPTRSGPSTARIGGVAVITRPRPTAGHVALGLFVRVPEQAPLVHTVAALVLEARSEGALTGRATADGIVLHAVVRGEAVRATIEAMARALGERDPREDEVAAALERVRRRRLGRRDDARALATRLAAEALVGRALDPLGAAEDDALVTPSAVAEVLGAGGVERALVVAVGDFDERAVHDAVASAFSGAAHVSAAATATSPLTGGLRVAEHEGAMGAVACAASDLPSAMRTARWLARLAPEADVSAFPLGGGAVVLGSIEGGEAQLAVLAARAELAAQLDDEAPTEPPLDAAAERMSLGDAWLAESDAPWSRAALGLALVRDEAQAGEPPDATALEQTLRTHIEAASRAPTIAHDVLAHGEAVTTATLANGATIRALRADTRELVVTMSLAAGAAYDPANEHGRAALLTRVLARACEPDADGWWTSADTIGLTLAGTPATLERTLLRAMECLSRAEEEVAHTEGLRAAAIAELREPDRLVAWAANVLAPSSPGLVAPRGDAAGLAAAAQLDTALRDALDARRVTFAIVGDVDADHAVHVAAILASTLGASGPTPIPPALGAASETPMFAADPEVDLPTGVIALRSDAGQSAEAARVVARALAERLHARGLAVRAIFGEAAMGTSFVAIGVTGPDPLLDTLPALVAEARDGLSVGDALPAAVASAEQARALSLASPRVLGRALAAPDSPSDPAAVAAGLLAAPAHLVLVRPGTSPIRRR